MLDENGDESRETVYPIRSYNGTNEIIRSLYDRRDTRVARRGRWMRLNGLGVAGTAKSKEESALGSCGGPCA